MNNLEIEYKILINQLPDLIKKIKPVYIEQFYFDYEKLKHIINQLFNFELSGEGFVSRVRKTIYPNGKEKYVLCLKSNGFIHQEYETIINQETYLKIKSYPIESLIIKNRYIDVINEHKFEFDEYLNLSKELFTVEVEIQDKYISIEEVLLILKDYYKLNNCIDVTNNQDYLNVNLIKTFGYKCIK